MVTNAESAKVWKELYAKGAMRFGCHILTESTEEAQLDSEGAELRWGEHGTGLWRAC